MNVRRTLGYIFVITAAAGLIFSVVGLVEIWRYNPRLSQAVSDNLGLFSQALTTTQDGLGIIDQEVQLITRDLASLQSTTRVLNVTIQDTNPILDSLVSLTSTDLPAAITATQTSLASAQSSSLLIDNVLSALTSIPFLPVTPYIPEVPLHLALAQVSTSLNSLKPSLATINTSLAISKTNMSSIGKELDNISETTKEMSSTFVGIQNIVDQYETVTDQLVRQVEAIQNSILRWITTLSFILSFILIWLLVAQFSLFIQGLALLGIPLEFRR